MILQCPHWICIVSLIVVGIVVFLIYKYVHESKRQQEEARQNVMAQLYKTTIEQISVAGMTKDDTKALFDKILETLGAYFEET